MTAPYPLWKFYPGRARPPVWVHPLIAVFAGAHTDNEAQLTSDQKLTLLRPALVGQGFDVEGGKKATDKLRRPVLFGELGAEERAYEVDAFHSDLGVGLEVEAGRVGCSESSPHTASATWSSVVSRREHSGHSAGPMTWTASPSPAQPTSRLSGHHQQLARSRPWLGDDQVSLL